MTSGPASGSTRLCTCHAQAFTPITSTDTAATMSVAANADRVADAHEADPALRSPAGVDDGRLEVDGRVAEVDAKDGQRHRLEEAVPNLYEHGYAARHTVRVERPLQMSRGDRGRLQWRN